VSAEPDQLPGRLTRLGLKSMRDRLDSLLDEAGRRDLSIRDALDLLCEAEVRHREERRIQMGLGIAKFPFVRTLDGFEFEAQPSLDPKQIRDRVGSKSGLSDASVSSAHFHQAAIHAA
jgi:DNA replication protein DnaC